jgi:hypothetical protein
MVLVRICVATPWIGSGSSTSDAYRPQLADIYDLESWEDKTCQDVKNIAPQPNAFNIEAVVDSQLVSVIDSDPRFVVWWSEDFNG